MRVKKFYVLILFVSLLLFFTKQFFLFSDEVIKGTYSIRIKQNGVLYKLYLNGFLLYIGEDNFKEFKINYFLKKEKNVIIIDVVQKSDEEENVIKLEIYDHSIHKRLFLFNIVPKKSKNIYKKEINVFSLKSKMPWEDSENIERLTYNDIEKIKEIVTEYKNVLKEGDKKKIIRFLKNSMRTKLLTEAMLANVSEDIIIERFIYFYEIFWGKSSRGKIYETDINNIIISKSPYDNRIIIVKSASDMPILRIESSLADENNIDNTSLIIDILNFIKIKGKWCIY